MTQGLHEAVYTVCAARQHMLVFRMETVCLQFIFMERFFLTEEKTERVTDLSFHLVNRQYSWRADGRCKPGEQTEDEFTQLHPFIQITAKLYVMEKLTVYTFMYLSKT